MSFYVTLQAKEADFKTGDLKAEFAKAYRLRGEWEVGIISCHTNASSTIFWVFSDIVDFTYVNNTPMQLMDVLQGEKLQVRKPLYSKVIKKTISSINMQFRQDPKSDYFSEFTDIACMLHFRKT